MPSPAFASIALALGAATAGVDYSPRHGARCPWCKKKMRIYSTLPWDGNIRIRYHHCENDRCPLARMKTSVKSVESEK